MNDRDWQAELSHARQEAERYQEIAAVQGERIMRLVLALHLAREWGIGARGYDCEIAHMLAEWIDCNKWPPISWPYSPFVQRWLQSRGYVEVHGNVGFKDKIVETPPPPTNREAAIVARCEGGQTAWVICKKAVNAGDWTLAAKNSGTDNYGTALGIIALAYIVETDVLTALREGLIEAVHKSNQIREGINNARNAVAISSAIDLDLAARIVKLAKLHQRGVAGLPQ